MTQHLKGLRALCFVAWAAALPAQVMIRHPFPQHIVYPGAEVWPSNFSQELKDTDVRAAYDDWKRNYVVALGTQPAQYRIAFGKRGSKHTQTVSEGQGYGMVIVAQMAGYDAEAKLIFDGLWRFARAHPSSGDAHLMAWQVPTKKGDKPDSAFDGDADIAYALLLADEQWGSELEINYRAEAVKLINAIMASTIGQDSHLPLLGDWVDPKADSGQYTQWQTRSSDLLYTHFRCFGNATRDVGWLPVIQSSEKLVTQLQKNFAAETGLLPDFVMTRGAGPDSPTPAKPDFLEGKNDGSYSYNACRVPWRIGTDALLFKNDAMLLQTQRLTTWIEHATGGDPKKIRAGYTLDGKPLKDSDYFTSVFAAPFAVAAMTSGKQQKWLNDLYAAVRGSREDYFEDSVTLLCLLVLSGNSWDPLFISARH